MRLLSIGLLTVRKVIVYKKVEHDKNCVIDHTCHSSYRNTPSNYIVDVVVTAIHRATLGVFTDTETKLENTITSLLVVTVTSVYS